MSRLRVARAVKTRSFVACQVGEARYVLPVEEVREIVQPMTLTALPHAPQGIIGAVEHRDEIVPVLDLGARLGFGRTSSSKSKWVLLRAHSRTLGVVVDHVLEVFEIAESAIRPAPDVGDVGARAANMMVSYRGGMAFILNMQAVAKLAEVALKEIESA